MFVSTRVRWSLAVVSFCVPALLSTSANGQLTRGPSDPLDRDQYGHRYRDNVFDDRYSDRDDDDYADRRARASRNTQRNQPDRYPQEDASFSEAYPRVPRVRPPRDETPPPDQTDFPRRTVSRYRPDVVRNDYAGAPVHRHYYGGVDRYDSPGYLDQAGRASAMSNGYSRRGVEEFRDAYGRGVRANDVYPLARDVNPRRYRGRMLNGAVSTDDEDTSGADELEDFVRSELSVRPGANLRVSSTGTYTFRNYVDQGNQVHARYRLPVHKRWEYSRGP
ncbi:MAG TPA: hypothetical protein VHC22_23660 [Pirellulales bacterium]|nr:hypothetical protein [Pirellulales bacterium]